MIILMIFVCIISGLIAGIIVNYIADVMPLSRKWHQAICVNCQQSIDWKSYLLFKPCHFCGYKRSIRAKLLPLIISILFTLLYLFPAQKIHFLEGWVLVTYFSMIFVIDLEYRIVFTRLVLLGCITCGIIGYLVHGFAETLIGGTVGFLIMCAFYWIGKIYIRSKNKHRNNHSSDEVALGFGDVYISGILGLLLGWPGIVAGLFLGILLGGITSIWLLVKHFLQKIKTPLLPIPYTPFLIIGGLILLLRPH